MDNKDKQIIRELQLSGRLTNQELADKINLSPSPCLRRVRALEKSGVITGYTAVVDEATFGLPITAFVGIRLHTHNEDNIKQFEQAIQNIDNILDCYVMTGNTDYLLRVVCDSLQGYEDFVRKQLHRIPGIAAVETGLAYGTVKKSPLLPIR